MTDKNLIKQLQGLKEINPREEWVLLTKENLFKEKKKFEAIEVIKKESFISIFGKALFNHKPAFAFAFSVLVFVGIFGFAQGSMPGDSLFSLKKIAEKGQAAFIYGGNQKTKYSLEIVNKRLDDLAKIAQSSANKNLAPAIKEYKQAALSAAKNLAQAANIKEIAPEVKKIEESEKKIKSLGVQFDDEINLDNTMKDVVKREIDSFQSQNISEADKQALNEAISYYESGNYSDALERLISIGKLP